MKPTSHQLRFIRELERITNPERLGRQDRAVLAALRQGLGNNPRRNVDIHRYVVPFLVDDVNSPDYMDEPEVAAFYQIAALYGLHPVNWPSKAGAERRSNFGASFHRLRSGDSASVERRFAALLNSHLDGLPNHLRRAVSILRTSETPIPVDYAQLIRDIDDWDHPDRLVQREWARSFWAPPRDQQSEESNEEAAE